MSNDNKEIQSENKASEISVENQTNNYQTEDYKRLLAEINSLKEQLINIKLETTTPLETNQPTPTVNKQIFKLG